MTEQKNDFGMGSVEQNIIRMAVPMTVAQILNLLYNLVDRMYIGHIPGASSLALTGVGITFPIISMITAFANLFGMGGAPLCSMARGRRDYERSEAVYAECVLDASCCGRRADGDRICYRKAASLCAGSQLGDLSLCKFLFKNLSSWKYVRHGRDRYEPVYQRAGIWNHGNGDGGAWRAG